MAFLFFTNAAEGFEGDSIAINTEQIITVLERKITIAADTGNTTKTTTVLFAGPYGTWEVKEPYLEVVARLNNKA